MNKLYEQLKLQKIEIVENLLNFEEDIKNISLAKLINLISENDEDVNVNFIDYLLEKGAEVDAIDEYSNTALILACSFGNFELIKLFIKYNANINFITKSETTPLIVSIENYFITKNLDIIEYLSENGVDFKSIGSNELSILTILLSLLNEKMLLQLQNDIKHEVSQSDIIVLVKYFITQGADINVRVQNRPIANLFAIQGNLKAFELLLDNGAEINQEEINHSMLLTDKSFKLLNNKNDFSFENLDKNKFEIIKLCKQKNINFDILLETSIFMYLDKENLKKINFINNKNIKFEDKLKAIIIGNNLINTDKKIIKFLFEIGARVTNKNKFVLIFQAIKKQQISILELLIKYSDGINLLQNVEKPLSLLFEALKTKNYNIIEILLVNKIDINEEYILNTPLLYAIKNKDIKLVKLLIAYGADVNKYCIDEVSPLLLATVLNEIEIVKILIQNGSDINFKTSDLNISIYDIANSYDDQRIVDLLELEGVEITETKEIDSFISVIKELYKETKKEKLITHDKESLQNIEKDMILKKEKLEQELNNSYEKQLEHYLDIEVKHILNEAVELKTEEKFQLLINAGFNFENIDINILFRDSFPTNFIKEVIRQSTNVNITDENGMAPIMYACQLNSIELVNLLLQKGADKNIKNNNGKRAKDFTNNKEIRELLLNYIFKTHNPQKLVKLLTNFTIDKPIKYTTHTWDFGELKKEYGNFDGYMNAVKNQFDTMKYELEELSLNLYKKIYTFLIEITPNENYSWCSKTNINIGWSSLDGLKEWCDSGKNPFDFKLQKPILIPPRKQISTFGEIINLFKQEIEIRSDFKNLETIFNFQKNKLDSDFKLDLSTSKLSRQFYTDTQRISFALDKIFAEIGKRKEFLNLEINSIELDDRSIEIAITQIDSTSNRSENELLERAKQSGDLADIVEILKNLCDYSIESSHENTHFRVNFLHSNNVRGIEILSEKPKGFSHILRFYK